MVIRWAQVPRFLHVAALKGSVRLMICFGLIADVQYSDMDDGNVEGRTQRYREAPAKLVAAVEAFSQQVPSLDFVLSLGDIINGNQAHPVMFNTCFRP